MGDLYASVLGVTVIRLAPMPPRPADLDGAVVIHGVHALDGAEAEIIEMLRSILSAYGTLIGISPSMVRLRWHSSKVMSRHRRRVCCSQLPQPADCLTLALRYSSIPNDARGWTTLNRR